MAAGRCAATSCRSAASRHDDVRGRMAAEHADVLGGDAPSAVDLPELSVTERVLQEALRPYPPAYITFRQAAEDGRVWIRKR